MVSSMTTTRRLAVLFILPALLMVGAGNTVALRSASTDLVTVLVSKLDAADSRPERLVHAVGGHVVRELKIIDGFVARVPSAAAAALAHAAGVRSVTPNRSLRL